jgi:phage-related protein
MKATLQRKSTSTSNSVAGPFFQPKPERTTGDVETSESREPTFFHSSQVEAADGTPPIQPTRARSAFETRENGHIPFFQQTRGTAIQTETEEHHADTLPVRRKPIFESEEDVQFRLLIGQPGDSYEQEADRMADRVAQRPPEHKKAAEPLLSTSRSSLQQTPIFKSEDALQKLEEPGKEEALQQKPIFESTATPPIDEGEGDEPHYRERGNEDLLQLKCAECAAEEETVQRLESTDATPVVPDDFSSQLRSNKGSGSTLPDDTRTHMESAFGADFSGVRIHADSSAERMSESVQAQAFTHGNDIYFGAGQYSPQSAEGQKLLAHELTHTIQQGATVRRKPAETPHETNHANAEPEAGQISQSEHAVQASSWWDDLKDGISAVWDATGGALTNAVLDQLFEAIRPYAPNLVNILQQIRSVGIVGFFKSKLTQAVDSIFGGLQSNIAIIAGIFPQFGALLTRARTIVTALASGDCKPLFAALNELKDLVTQMAGEAWDAIVIFFQPAINFFTDIWQSFGLPAIEWLKQKAAAVWEWVQGIGRSIWNWLLPVREALGSAWDAIKRFLGLNADETGEEGLIQWAQRKAGEIWEGIKEELRPIIEPARALVGKIQALIPLNAILNLRATIQDWLQQAAATATGMGEDASNVGNIAAQTSLRDQILPAIQQSLESFRGSIAAAATWVSGTIGEIYASVTQFFTSVRSISLLNLASGLIGWVETKANEIYEWVQSKVAALFDLASQGLHKLGEFLQPVYDTLVKIGQILGNILGYLPDFLLGPLWMLLPQCIKNPIKEFFLTQILGRLPFFQKLQQIEGIWERLQAAAITILKQVFVDGNLRGAIWTFFSTMLDILGLPPQLVTRVIAKGAQALGDILNDPLGFLGNFLQAMKLGLEGFFNNIGTHLLGGLQAWLFSQFEGTGIEMPQDFSFKSMLKLVFQVLGITVDMLLEILEEVTGRKGLKAKVQKVIGAISNAWDWFQKLIAESKEGESLWDRLSNAVGSIWDFILNGVVGWLEQTIVKRALAWIAKKLDPTGVMAVITTIIDVFALLEAIMSKAKEIFEMIERVLDRIGEIIKGILPAAAEVLERALAAAIPVAMAILAAVVGLDGAVDTVKEEIQKLREKVRNGIKRVMMSIKDWILRMLGGNKDDGKDTLAAALQEIDTEAEHESDEGEVKQDEAEAIKNKVNQDHPDVIKISSIRDGGATWDFEYVQLQKHSVPKRQKISKYVELKNGKYMLLPEYAIVSTSQGRTIRARFYGTSYRNSIYDMMEEQLTTPKGRKTPSGFNGLMNPNKSNEFWWNGKYWSNSGATKATIEHMHKVVDHWNDDGRLTQQPDRKSFYNNSDDMEVMPSSENKRGGGETETGYKFEVGKNFRGPDDNPL